jgi:hypothetical protein
MGRLALPLTLALVTGCSSGAPEALDSATKAATCAGPDARPMHWVIDSLHFARVTDGVSDGFDLDGTASSGSGTDGCGRADFTSPDGVPGIDNAFGEVIPALENTEFVAAEALINDTIKTGELMLLVSMDHVDDAANDDCIDLSLGRATGDPMLGTDEAFLPGQTLSRDTSFAEAVVSETFVKDGVATGRPISATIPLQVLDASLEFEVLDGAIRLQQHADGMASGVFAGGLDIATVIYVASNEGIAQELKDILASVLYVVADLAPDENGDCQELSITFEFTATPVYLFDE